MNLESHMMVRVLKRNSILRFSEMSNRYVYMLGTGVVKIVSVNESGREIIKHLVKPGEFFGELPLLGDMSNLDDLAVAIEDSNIYFTEIDKLRQLLNDQQEFRTKLLKQAAERIRKAEDRIVAINTKEVYERVCDFLLQLIDEFGDTKNEVMTVRNFLTHDDMAKLTDTSRQTVSRVLNDLRDKGEIEYDTQQIRIPKSSSLLVRFLKVG